MSIRVYGADTNPAVDDFLYRCSCSSGANIVATGRGLTIIDRDGRRAIQLLEGADTCTDARVKESVGLSALIPFARVLNPMIAPQKLHYQVPMAGDRTAFARSGMRRTIERTIDGEKLTLRTRTRAVSSRVLFSQPGIQWANYAPVSATV